MGVRSVTRFVDYRITAVPESGLTVTVSCAEFECGATSGPHDNWGVAQDWALLHRRATGHKLYRREASDHARVTEQPSSPHTPVLRAQDREGSRHES